MTKLTRTAFQPDWDNDTVNVVFSNGDTPEEGKDLPYIHVGMRFPLDGADKAGAKARAKDVLKAAIAALD